MKKFFSLFAIILSINSFAKVNLDSLHQIWLDESKTDAVRFKAMSSFTWKGYLFTNPDTAFMLAQELKLLAQKKENKKWVAKALNIQGISCDVRGRSAEALEYYQSSLKIQEEIGDKKGIASSLGNIGIIYNEQGNIKAALDHYERGLQIHQELGNKNGLAGSLNNIGMLYEAQGDIEKALEYNKRCLKIREEIGDKSGIALSLNNIGTKYRAQGEIQKALDYFMRSLNMLEELGDKRWIALLLNNLGKVYEDQDNIEEALNFHIRSLKLREELDDKRGIAESLINIGIIYNYQGQLKEAITYSNKSFTIAQAMEDPVLINKSALCLSEIYEKQKEGMKALEMYKLHIQMRDSVRSEDAKKGLLKMEVKHQFEKDQLVKQQEEKEVARIEEEEIATRNSIQYSGIGLGIFALFGLLFFIGNFSLPKWALELSVFLPFLIFFEFLLVLTDPYVDAITGGEPLMKLLLNALLAGAIFPLHAFFEKLMKKRVIKSI